MFDRFESFKKAIADRSLDFNTLQLMIDFHMLKGTLTQEQGDELLALMYPPPKESEEENET